MKTHAIGPSLLWSNSHTAQAHHQDRKVEEGNVGGLRRTGGTGRPGAVDGKIGLEEKPFIFRGQRRSNVSEPMESGHKQTVSDAEEVAAWIHRDADGSLAFRLDDWARGNTATLRSTELPDGGLVWQGRHRRWSSIEDAFYAITLVTDKALNARSVMVSSSQSDYGWQDGTVRHTRKSYEDHAGLLIAAGESVKVENGKLIV